MVNRFNPTVSKTTLIRPSSEEEPFRPQDFGFSFAFGLNNKTLDPSIGFFTVKYIQQAVVDSKRIKTKTDLEFKPCGNTLFTYEN